LYYTGIYLVINYVIMYFLSIIRELEFYAISSEVISSKKSLLIIVFGPIVVLTPDIGIYFW